jgi:hypothetical protein
VFAKFEKIILPRSSLTNNEKMNIEPITEQIEAYLDQRLSDDALLVFEEKLNSSTELQQEVALHRQIRGFLTEKMVGDLKTQVKDWIREDEQAETLTTTKPTFSIWRNPTLWRAAASVLLVVGLGWWFLRPADTLRQSPGQYMAVLAAEGPGVLQSTENLRSVWSEAFNQKKYEVVTQILDTVSVRSAEEQYYWGLAYSLQKPAQYDKAVQVLSDKTIAKSIYKDKAEWTIALCYLQQGQTTQAKALLTKIAATGNSFSEDAAQLSINAKW